MLLERRDATNRPVFLLQLEQMVIGGDIVLEQSEAQPWLHGAAVEAGERIEQHPQQGGWIGQRQLLDPFLQVHRSYLDLRVRPLRNARNDELD